MSDKNVDLIVIGAGPGGYVAAIRAAQLGLKVAVVDKRITAGGTCLNVGCIPSKALLHSSHKYAEVKGHLDAHGISVSDVKLDLSKMLARKDTVVSELTKGVAYLLRKNNITFINGLAQISGPGKVRVVTDAGEEEWQTKNIVIATGSESSIPPGFEVDEKRIVTSTGGLSLTEVPKHMVVVGGGYIGLEMGSVWSRLGAKVTVVEFLDRIVPAMDHELGTALHKELEKQGITFLLSTKVVKIDKKQNQIDLYVTSAEKEGSGDIIPCDVVLVSAGRRPYTENLGLESVGIQTDGRGFISVNASFQTTAPGIYAIGDVIGNPMLAHKAEDEGVAVAENIAGQAGHVNYNVIPAVIYTAPEVASVGKSEEQLKQEGMAYKAGKFPFLANSRAKALGETTGFVKVLADAKTDRVLGVHIIGELAGTMIAEAAHAMEMSASSEDIARTCHAHPTHAEALKEAAFATFDKAIHI